MIDIVATYFLVLLAFQPIEEIHNCNNPNTIGSVPHVLCVWTDKDFVALKNGGRILRPKRKADNSIKAYYREKWWRENKCSQC